MFAPSINQVNESSVVPSISPVDWQSKLVLIGVVVLNDLNRNAIFDEGKVGVGNVIIYAQMCTDNKVVALGSSTWDGSYILRNISPIGCYYIMFMESKRYYFTKSDADNDQILKSSATNVIDWTG